MERRLQRRAGTKVAGAAGLFAAFLAVHVGAQASILGGAEAFEAVAGALGRVPFASVAAVVLAGAPLALALRAALGARTSLPASRSRWELAALGATLGFLLWHAVVMLRARARYGGGRGVLVTTLTEHLSSTAWGIPWNALATIAGLGAACLWLACVARSADAQRARAAILGAGALFVLGTLTVVSAATGGPSGASGEPASDEPCYKSSSAEP